MAKYFGLFYHGVSTTNKCNTKEKNFPHSLYERINDCNLFSDQIWVIQLKGKDETSACGKRDNQKHICIAIIRSRAQVEITKSKTSLFRRTLFYRYRKILSNMEIEKKECICNRRKEGAAIKKEEVVSRQPTTSLLTLNLIP